MRNRPLLDLIVDLVCRKKFSTKLKICDLGCSKGAEIYSLLFLIRQRKPDFEISGFGVDISPFAIDQAKKGIYRHDSIELEQLTQDERESLFIKEGDFFRVQDWIRQGISWVVEDAKNPVLLKLIGSQNIVLANNFLIHLRNPEAKACLQNIMNLVAPGGFLCLWNVDPDLKIELVMSFMLKPIYEKIEQIYEADKTALNNWPWKYWGEEPLDKTRHDWVVRYSMVFEVPDKDSQDERD